MLPLLDLADALRRRLVGSSELRGLALRPRGRRAKVLVCEALGLTPPAMFPRTSPRFPEEQLDVAVQQSNNFQLWNQELDPARRYAFLVLDPAGDVRDVRVLSGEALGDLVRSRTRTTKVQARCRGTPPRGLHVVAADTPRLAAVRAALAARGQASALLVASPCDAPDAGLLALEALAEQLAPLVGLELADPGVGQDRRRGQGFHAAVCHALGYAGYADPGRAPDLPHQLLEVKLQTAATIDLGAFAPDVPLPLESFYPAGLTRADVRYAVAHAEPVGGDRVRIRGLVLTTGAAFYEAYARTGGDNGKLQIRLPAAWWTDGGAASDEAGATPGMEWLPLFAQATDAPVVLEAPAVPTAESIGSAAAVADPRVVGLPLFDGTLA